MKRVASLIAVLLLLAGVVIAAARLGAFEPDPAAALAQYGAPPSQFIEIDGTRMHYRDEGQGPVLVLMHGSRGSLQQWDGWVRELGSHFRIIRFDAPAHGLTGADGRDDYSSAREIYLMHELLNRLKVDRFVLAGTSSGATVAVRYTAAHPERVVKLVLSTVPLKLPAQSKISAFDQSVFWAHDTLLGTLATDVYWRTFLRSLFGNPAVATPELVRRYRVLNTLPGQQQRFRRRIALWLKGGGAKADYALAAAIKVPTLIQWGGAGPVLPKEMFCAIADAFKSTPVRVIVYPQLGHMLVLEDPVLTARDALAFIDTGVGGEACRAAPPMAAAPSAPAAGAPARN